MDIVLTGTGSPIPDQHRAGPSTLVRAGDAHLLVDAALAIGAVAGLTPGESFIVGDVPASVSARRTQPRNVSRLIDNFAAIDSIAFHCDG